MSYENIFNYVKNNYISLSVIAILVFFLIISTIFAKSNETIVEPVVIEKVVEKKVETETIAKSMIYVDLKGEVAVPGVYQMEKGDRIIDVINIAGGFTIEANSMPINLSQKLKDQMVIIIPSIDSNQEELVIEPKKVQEDDGLICLNTSTVAELTTLPGIGEARANDIIQYRETHGFNEISDLLNVSGIGAATFANIKDLVKI